MNDIIVHIPDDNSGTEVGKQRDRTIRVRSRRLIDEEWCYRTMILIKPSISTTYVSLSSF